jgi:uncharacterized protein YkwD
MKTLLRKIRLIHVAIASAVVVFFGMVSIITAQLNKQLPTPSTQASQYVEPDLLTLINQVRAKGGKPALTVDDPLNQAAQARNAFMVEQASWGHVGSGGEQWYSVDQQYAPNRQHYGENLSRCYNSNTDVVKGWVNSPQHYAILMGDFAKVGFNTVYETKTISDTYHTPNQQFSNCYIVAAEFSN